MTTLEGVFFKKDEIKENGAYKPTVDFYVENSRNPAYPSYAKFRLTGDKITMLDALKSGQRIEVYFNVNGRFWQSEAKGTSGYIQDLEVWKIDILTKTSVDATAFVAKEKEQVTAAATAEVFGADDAIVDSIPPQVGGDIPF